jgi:hypothetical protein
MEYNILLFVLGMILVAYAITTLPEAPPEKEREKPNKPRFS